MGKNFFKIICKKLFIIFSHFYDFLIFKHFYFSQSNLYSINYSQDWLIRPPPASPYFSKYRYENQFSNFAKLIDMFLLRDEKDIYVKFEESVRHDRMMNSEGNDFIKKKIEKNKEKI